MNLSARLKHLEDILFDPSASASGKADPRRLMQRVFADPEAYALAKRLAERLPIDATSDNIKADPEAMTLATSLRDRLNAAFPSDPTN